MTRRELIAALSLAIGETADEETVVMVRVPAMHGEGERFVPVLGVEWEHSAPVIVCRGD